MSTVKLNMLRPRHGIDKKALGRGIGSGCGKTSSYGHKGGKARSGRGAPSWFEGGQTPLYRRLPKRGFTSRKDKRSIGYINLGTLATLCEAGVFKKDDKVSIEELKANGVIKKDAMTLRLLGKGELNVALNIVVNYATKNAFKAVEACGGKIELI